MANTNLRLKRDRHGCKLRYTWLNENEQISAQQSLFLQDKWLYLHCPWLHPSLVFLLHFRAAAGMASHQGLVPTQGSTMSLERERENEIHKTLKKRQTYFFPFLFLLLMEALPQAHPPLSGRPMPANSKVNGAIYNKRTHRLTVCQGKSGSKQLSIQKKSAMILINSSAGKIW